MADLIEEFLDVTESIRSPERFRLWTIITTIAAVLERKVWTVTDVNPLYPNLFTMLGGNPASGKTIMTSLSRELLGSIKDMRFGPDSPTKESFWDKLEDSGKLAINGMGVPVYSAMYQPAGEWGDFMSKYDHNFASSLSTIYDNPLIWSAPRRTSKDLLLEAPTLNILGAITPAALGDIIPDTAWGQGFTSRIVFVYGVAPAHLVRQMFVKRKDDRLVFIKARLEEIFKTHHGEFIWEEPAQKAIEHWYNVLKGAPLPTYGKLVNYNGRRDTHLMKLAMISSVSGERFPYVTLNDFERACSWLFEAEKEMPNIFRAMIQRSDSGLIQDLAHWMYTEYSKVDIEKRKPLTEKELWIFMENKSTTDKIPKLIQAAERMGYIKRGPGFGMWLPGQFNVDVEQDIPDIMGEPGKPYEDYLEQLRRENPDDGEIHRDD